MDIARLMSREQQYVFSPEGEEAFPEYLERRMEQPRFANARSVRNALDRLRMGHAIRLWKEATEDGKKLTKGDLVTIQAEDVRKSQRGSTTTRCAGLRRPVGGRRAGHLRHDGAAPGVASEGDDFLNGND